MSTIDWAVVIIYMLAIVGLGVAAGLVRAKGETGGEGGHYFLAGNSLGWPVIGLAMFAANISTVHLVSLAQTAYTSGLLYGNYEWMAGFTLILLSLFFAPLYLRSKVSTLPDYLERRYNRNCRDLLSFVSLISAIVIHIGVALFTAGAVLCYILGIDGNSVICGLSAQMFFVVVLGVFTGIYTVVGGLLAVVWTESIQTLLLLIGAVCITAVGYHAVGGWSELSALLSSHPHPLLGHEGGPLLSTKSFLHIAHEAGDTTVIDSVPWYSILLGYPVIGIWYWCCDQTIVQRVLAAKDETNARLGPLFCAFLKILPVFFFVLPGVICVALVQKGYFGFETVHSLRTAIGPAKSGDVYPFMITHLLPVGIKGLVIAAMLAAAMQTCSAALNSAATLFAYDIWKRWIPQTTDSELVSIGRWTTVVSTVIAIVLSQIFGHYSTIFKGLNTLICYIAPPITAVFLVGVFWKKAGGRAAFLTMLLGSIMGIVCFTLDFYKEPIVKGAFERQMKAEISTILSEAKDSEQIRTRMVEFYNKPFVKNVLDDDLKGKIDKAVSAPNAIAQLSSVDFEIKKIPASLETSGMPVFHAIYDVLLADFMLASFGLFVMCVIIQIGLTVIFQEEVSESAKALTWDNWLEPVMVKCGTGLSDYRLMSGLILGIFVFLYCVFF